MHELKSSNDLRKIKMLGTVQLSASFLRKGLAHHRLRPYTLQWTYLLTQIADDVMNIFNNYSVGYELAIYHLITNKREWNGIIALLKTIKKYWQILLISLCKNNQKTI